MRRSNLQNALVITVINPLGLIEVLTFDGMVDTISDNLSPGWDTVQQAGMPEGKKLYSSFQRQATINFFVIAEGLAAHLLNRRKLKKLATAAYPYKVPGSGYNGHYITVKFGKVLNATGVVTSLSYDWTSEYTWGLDKMPMITSVNLTLDIIADAVGKKPSQNHIDYFGI